jgi:hypothetical protein
VSGRSRVSCKIALCPKGLSRFELYRGLEAVLVCEHGWTIEREFGKFNRWNFYTKLVSFGLSPCQNDTTGIELHCAGELHGEWSLYQMLVDPDSGCMAGLRTRYLELWEFLRLGIIAELDSKILVTIHIHQPCYFIQSKCCKLSSDIHIVTVEGHIK